jgi:hypothetical protein
VATSRAARQHLQIAFRTARGRITPACPRKREDPPS